MKGLGECFVFATDHELCCVDYDGHFLWRRALRASQRYGGAIRAGDDQCRVIVDNALEAIQTRTGKVLWTYIEPKGISEQDILFLNSNLTVFLPDPAGMLVVLDPAGKLRLQLPCEPNTSDLLSGKDNLLYLASPILRDGVLGSAIQELSLDQFAK